MFLVYVKDIWKNIELSIRLFAESCIIYGKITNINDIEMLQKDLNTSGEWAVENGMKIDPGKIKALRFRRARDKIFWLLTWRPKFPE